MTPAPWKIATTFGSKIIDIVPWATQKQRLARLTVRADYPLEQALADARIMAAAPTVLEALENLFKAIRNGGKDDVLSAMMKASTELKELGR